jgi:succinoglycan biosynthesis transport protein ExoP
VSDAQARGESGAPVPLAASCSVSDELVRAAVRSLHGRIETALTGPGAKAAADSAPAPLSVLMLGAHHPATATACRLAVSSAESGHATALIDGGFDLTPGEKKALAVPADRAGWTDWLIAGGTGPVPLCETDVPGLILIPQGSGARQAAASLRGEHIRRLHASLRGRAERLIWAGPSEATAAVATIAAAVDIVVIVVRPGKTTRETLARVRTTVEAVGGSLLGAVLVDD